MNYKLILLLSVFGLAMGIGTVEWIPASFEWIIWLVIFLLCAVLIARYAGGKYFMHGFLLSILNSVWNSVVHYFLSDLYWQNHPFKAARAEHINVLPPDIIILIIGPIVGIVFGLVLGLFSYIASKIVKKANSDD